MRDVVACGVMGLKLVGREWDEDWDWGWDWGRRYARLKVE